MELNRPSIVVIIIVVLQVWWCYSCSEHEREALFNLKASLNYPNGSSLSSWGTDTDCCNWENIECSLTTRRISRLFLSSTRDWNLGDWYLNASLFLPFKELNALYLSRNHIAGFEGVLRLSNLELLDLSENEFEHSILSSLSSLSSLKSLFIYNIGLKGINDIQELDGLTSLKVLDMGGNKIEFFESFHDVRGLSNLSTLFLDDIATKGRSISLKSLEVFPSVKTFYLRGNNIIEKKSVGQEFDNLTNLEELYLDYSILDEGSFQSLGSLPSLKLLSMYSNNGILPIQGFSNFKALEHLDLSFSTVNNSLLQTVGSITFLKTLSLSGCGISGTYLHLKLRYLRELDIRFNDLTGTLPWCLVNLTYLEILRLSSNHLTGNISSSPLRNLTSIHQLVLSDNNFQIPISLSSFFNHSELKVLDVRNNEIHADIEEHSLTPKFQLEYLVFSGHGYGGAFPKFLYYQYDLNFVELSHIQMRGSFPFWLLKNNTKLQTLFLVNNSLSGPLQLPIPPHMHLADLDISNNQFYGNIPIEISALPKLTSLNMSRSGFSGRIPSSFGNMTSLEVLDLSNNGLSGGIPEHLAMGCFSLHFLLLSNNKLQGQIFSGIVNLTNLWWLRLDGNQFQGSIPDSLSNCTSLTRLYVNKNSLSGRIPRWMGDMSSLEVLDLSENNIFGSLPSNFSPPQMQQVYLSKNKLQGSLKDAFYGCSELMTLDLSHNSLSGSIPNWIGKFSQLSYLLLSHNKLEGEIPNEMCKLNQLSLIDLSHNNLSGHILPCLKFNSEWNRQFETPSAPSPDPMQQPIEFTTKSVTYSYPESILSYLSGIDLSCNSLTGEIPAEIGNSSMIQALNFSHNSLTGQIPATFSNLQHIESLDLSYNNLDGKIPPQLTQLYSLAVFSVAYNNLSGKTPDRVAQFATFDNSSFEGNPFLCGLPLPKSCTAAKPASPMPEVSTDDNNEKSGFIDMSVFYVSFLVAYSMVLLAMLAVLCINPYWRQAWFYWVEVCIANCQHFLEDNVYNLFKLKLP